MIGISKFAKIAAALTLSITILCSTMSMNSYALQKPWYEDSVNQLIKTGVMSADRTSPFKKVTAQEFLKSAVLWFTYNHGEDFNKVVNDLQWVKDGEINLNAEINRSEAVRIVIRGNGTGE